jgi:hypothetical protein
MEPTLVEIIIPGRIEPLERGDRFEDPLHEYLSSGGLGSVGGAGTTLGAPDVHGRQFVSQCSIWIELFDLASGLDLVCQKLRALGAPPGSYLEYLVGGKLESAPVWPGEPAA